LGKILASQGFKKNDWGKINESKNKIEKMRKKGGIKGKIGNTKKGKWQKKVTRGKIPSGE